MAELTNTTGQKQKSDKGVLGLFGEDTRDLMRAIGLGMLQQGKIGPGIATGMMNLDKFRKARLDKRTYEQKQMMAQDLGSIPQDDPDYGRKAAQVAAKYGDYDTAMQFRKNGVSQWGLNPVNTDKGLVQFNESGEYRVLPLKGNPNLQYVQGNQYSAPVVFDPGEGKAVPVQGGYLNQGYAAPGQTAAGIPGVQAPSRPVKDFEAKQDYATLSKMSESLATAKASLQDMERFGELNRKTGSGGVLNKLGAAQLSNDPAVQEMQAITSRLTGKARPIGSGATSDFEQRLYMQSVPSIEKVGDANRNMRESYKKQVAEAQKQYDFAQRYYDTYGTLNGWQQAYSKGAQQGAVKAKPSGATLNATQQAQAQKWTERFGSLTTRDKNGKTFYDYVK